MKRYLRVKLSMVLIGRGKAGTVRVWTIGYGSRSKEQLLNMLKASRIEVVVDVRRWPTSKLKDFKRENMEKWLKEANINYIWMGETLGGYRKEGYENHMNTKTFKQGLKTLLKLISEKRVCLLCLEVSPRGCHRRFISRALQREGVKVSHILR
ncbi:MAG: DUF488 domain-containing protein [Candidatus Nezhaarchaeales archaeon]